MQNKTPAKRPQRRPQPLTHQVRIIGGQWKRTPLPVLAAEGLRPTPDRVRETVFNWVSHLRDGHWEGVTCLDLFAGSGALGFEAASRGAARVVMVESHGGAVQQLEATRDKLKAEGMTILRGDALKMAQGLITRTGEGQFDLIFLDPPYHQAWLPKMLPLCRRLLAPGGIVYVESETALAAAGDSIVSSTPGIASPAWLAGWDVVRADRAGMVFYHLLQCGNDPEVEA